MLDSPCGFAHIQLGAKNLARATAFYDRLLPILGWTRVNSPDRPGAAGVYWRHPGHRWPQFVLNLPFDGEPATAGNGTQVSFLTNSPEMVRELWSEAIEAGGTDEGPPGQRPQYAADFFGAYCRDTEGNKLCFVYTEPEAE